MFSWELNLKNISWGSFTHVLWWLGCAICICLLVICLVTGVANLGKVFIEKNSVAS
jgi:hypothetical protein